ncbi:MAG: hypothetical protein IJD43_04270 [Thermoguttaceae bacterium]|nr:hypothetical protein [Thermoguttaceae bacterium]
MTYDNEQSDEWTLSDGSGRAVEDYGYDYALSASGSYSLSMENGSASVYGTSASNDTLAWRDRTEYRYSVADGEWQTNMTGWTRQTAVSGSSYAGSGSGAGTSGDAVSGSSWEAQASEEGAFLRAEVTEIDWSFLDGEYTASGHVHTDYDITGEYGFSSENDFWQSSSSTHSSGWNSYSDTSHNERGSNETMVFHHERDENYEWSLDETGRVYVSAYDYEQSGSMSANGHRGGSGTYNYESSSYTQGNGWSSFYHSGSFGSSSFYDEYDFTADWSESFDGVTNSYSSAHSASNNVEGDNYSLSGYFSDYYKTWDGQSPDSGGYSDSYPSSSPYASTTTDNGFSFTWSGHDIASRQGVYLHNAPYSGMWEIPYGLGSYSNPVEQPNSAWPTDPETPEPYSSPSQSYVDDLDAFFYGYDNTDLYETGLQEYGEITLTNASGSASYSGYESFYDDFTDGSVGNEGVGSGLTEEQKNSIGSTISETITDGDNSLIDPVTIITCSYSATPNTRGQNNNVHWSLYRWFWTGDGRASDEVMEAALTAAGNSYFENAEYAHAGLNAVSYVDPTGLAETTNQALYDMEDGKSLTQIGGNAVKNIVYDRVVDKVTSKVPTPGGDPTDKVGFAKNVTKPTKRYNGPKPKYKINKQHVPSPQYKHSKTPLPSDAEVAYKNAVPRDIDDGSTWYALSTDGKQIYRYSGNNNNSNEVHFSGAYSPKDSQVPNYVKKRLGIR